MKGNTFRRVRRVLAPDAPDAKVAGS